MKSRCIHHFAQKILIIEPKKQKETKLEKGLTFVYSVYKVPPSNPSGDDSFTIIHVHLPTSSGKGLHNKDLQNTIPNFVLFISYL